APRVARRLRCLSVVSQHFAESFAADDLPVFLMVLGASIHAFIAETLVTSLVVMTIGVFHHGAPKVSFPIRNDLRQTSLWESRTFDYACASAPVATSSNIIRGFGINPLRLTARMLMDEPTSGAGRGSQAC